MAACLALPRVDGGPTLLLAGDLDTNGRLDLVTANTDGDGVGGQGETATRRANIDTTRPVTKAPYAASVRRYATATLRYRVDDARPGSPTATVTVKIKNSRGGVVKTLSPGTKSVNTTLSTRFACTLPKGTYRFYLYASDQARNAQSKIGSNRLVVRWARGGSAARPQRAADPPAA